LNPYDVDFYRNAKQMRQLLDRSGMRSVIETGARFLLDPRVKHEPTLVSEDPAGRRRRIEFLCRAVDAAAQLKSDCVSLWAGVVREPIGDKAALERLVLGLREVVDYASEREVAVGFEPEPGMAIDTMASFERLGERLERPQLCLTLDVGHLHCLGETPIDGQIRRFAPRLVNVHIEDMRAGVHEHLMFGEGEIAFPPVLQALAEVGYAGGVHVELSRHSHMAPEAARRAFEFLSPLMP
jgi:sugar phosphate isomerase/epimerase